MNAALRGFETHRTGLIVKPTGTGKTVVAAETCRRWTAGRIMFLAESRQILRQAQASIMEWTGEGVGLEQAENYSCGERIVCASRQTLAAGDLRLEKYVRNPPTLIIVDEAHHAGKRKGQYEKILAKFPGAKILGLTATPDRGDKLALEVAFETVFFKYEIHEAVGDGWLVPVETAMINNWEALDLSRIKKVAGELDERALEELLAQCVKAQAKAAVEACGDRKSIVFCGRVETAHQMAAAIDAELGRSGAAKAVDGGMDDDEKDDLLDGFKEGAYQYLVNVGIATEGFDCPDAVAAVLTRPYLSRGRFTQACGRVLRPLKSCRLDAIHSAEGRRAAIAASAKPAALLVNFRFIPGRHTLVCPEDILGGKYDDETKAKAREMREDGEAKTVQESLEKANEAVLAERRRKADLAAMAKAKTLAEWGSFDPFGALGVERPDGEIEVGGEGYAEASAKMKWWLRSQGLQIPANLSAAAAKKLRGTLEARRNARLAVLGQVRWLTERGVKDAHRLTYDSAAQTMNEMQRKGAVGP